MRNKQLAKNSLSKEIENDTKRTTLVLKEDTEKTIKIEAVTTSMIKTMKDNNADTKSALTTIETTTTEEESTTMTGTTNQEKKTIAKNRPIMKAIQKNNKMISFMMIDMKKGKKEGTTTEAITTIGVETTMNETTGEIMKGTTNMMTREAKTKQKNEDRTMIDLNVANTTETTTIHETTTETTRAAHMTTKASESTIPNTLRRSKCNRGKPPKNKSPTSSPRTRTTCWTWTAKTTVKID